MKHRPTTRLRSVRNGRIGPALIGLLALILVPVIGTASAQESGSDACPSTVSSAGFLDVAGLSSESIRAIDCVAHYGITLGTSSTTYSPEDNVTRSQMAHFLTRTAEALGSELPVGESSPFEDISGLDAGGRRAIARLYELGITQGRESGLFDPDGSVDRRQMTIFLSRTLAAAGVAGEGDADALPYGDLEGESEEVVTAIAGLSALGVEWPGTTDVFDPERLVTREEMALLLAASLEAGDARHVVLTIDLSGTTGLHDEAIVVTVTAIKPNGAPYRGLLVDIFVSGFGFRFDGACFLDSDAYLYGIDAGTSVDCTIDRADPRTNYRGQVKASLGHGPRAERDYIHAWVGEMGQEFHESRPHRVTAVYEWTDVPSRIEIDGPIEGKYGETVAVEAQLLGSRRGNRQLVMMVIRDGVTVHTVSRVTPHNGKVDFVLVGPDDPSSNNDDELVETIKVYWDRNGNWVHNGPAEISDETTVTWDD